MANMDQMFAGMETAQMFGSGQYFSEGNFLLGAKSYKVNDGYKGRCFIAEFDVEESSNTKDPIGATRSYVVKMGPTNRNAFADIKSLIFAVALGIDPKRAGQPTDPGTIVVGGIFEELPIEKRTMSFAQAHAQATMLVKAACDPDYARQVGLEPGMPEGRKVRLQTFAKPTKPTAERPQGGLFTVHAFSPVETLQ